MISWSELDEPWRAVFRKALKTDGDPTAAKLAGLTGVQISGKAYKDLEPLRGLTKLETLVLVGSPVSDLAPLSQLVSLEKIYIRLCRKLTDLAPLDALPRLRVLQLHDTGVKVKTIKEFRTRHPGCEVDDGR